MVNKSLMKKLEDKQIIDERFLLWWNLGYEGRRVYREEEFRKNLTEVTYLSSGNSREDQEVKQRNFRVWQNENVPILIKNVDYNGIEFPVFVTVKPLHPRKLEQYKQFKSPPQANEEPHIRGVVSDIAEEFLFWFPIIYGEPQFSYDTAISSVWEEAEEKVLSNSLNPSTFWINQIKLNWHKGKRTQRKAEVFDFCKEDYKVVPYYEFDANENHIMIYPGKIFEERLDLPIVIKGAKESDSCIPEILGVGYFNFDEFSFRDMKREDRAYYWKLDISFKRKAKKSLISRLGDLSKKR